MPAMMGNQNMPGIPNMPNIPHLQGMPNMANMPGIPGMPTLQNMMGPSMGGMPGGPQQQMPMIIQINQYNTFNFASDNGDADSGYDQIPRGYQYAHGDNLSASNMSMDNPLSKGDNRSHDDKASINSQNIGDLFKNPNSARREHDRSSFQGGLLTKNRIIGQASDCQSNLSGDSNNIIYNRGASGHARLRMGQRLSDADMLSQNSGALSGYGQYRPSAEQGRPSRQPISYFEQREDTTQKDAKR